METLTPITVQETDIDEMEHVNNSVYVMYLEKGRKHWYEESGLSIQEMSKLGIGTVVLRLNILFQKEIRLGEVVRVRTVPVKLGKTSFTFEQEILNARDEVVTKANVVSVMFSTKDRKSTKVANEIAKHFPH